MDRRAALITFGLALLLAGACSGRSAKDASRTGAASDWLIDPSPFRAQVRIDPRDPATLHLENGLVRRTFRLSPNAATIDLRSLVSGAAVLRAVRPEASIVLDGIAYDIGGLRGQPEQGYLLESWLPAMTADPGAYRFRDYETGPVTKRLDWLRKRAAEDRPWPPPGIRLVLRFDPPASFPAGPRVDVVYELYDGLPLMAKRLEIECAGAAAVRLDAFRSEILAAVEPESSVNTPADWEPQTLHVESDLAFLADSPKTAAKTTFWTRDPSYTSQVNYELKTPCLLESKPPVGPAAV
ncbi:MAG TPA: hypothetical protein VKT17_09690, partial [Acidobacteriota bacterium]|nr:hypothetical protein [Acidobacteriota bacterium]